MSQINSVGTIGGGGGGGGTGILTINDIGADVDNNFTLEALNGIALSGITNGLSIKNIEGVSEFVVDSQGNAGYTTIQSAITAAALVADSTTPQTVWIWPGTYVENLILKPWVNLSGLGDALGQSAVLIEGNAVYADPSTGNLSLLNIRFLNTSSSPAISFQSNSASIVSLTSVYCSAGDWTAFECTGSGMTIYYNGGYLDCNSDANIFNISSGTTQFIGVFSNFNNASFQSEITGGTHSFINCYFKDSIDTAAATPTINISNSFIDSRGDGGNFPCITCGNALCILNISNVIMASTHASYVITSTGSLSYSNIVSIGGKVLDPGLTLTNFLNIFAPISFDRGVTTLNTATQCSNHQVVLGTGTSALSVVSGTGTTGQVLTSQGSSANPVWSSLSSGVYSIDTITSSDSPYTVDPSVANYISVDTSAGAVTVLMPTAPSQGTYIIIKDAAGDSSSNNITISTVSGSVNIDGVFTKTISTNFQSLEFIYNSTHYEVF
jgi:hypothetical protein